MLSWGRLAAAALLAKAAAMARASYDSILASVDDVFRRILAAAGMGEPHRLARCLDDDDDSTDTVWRELVITALGSGYDQSRLYQDEYDFARLVSAARRLQQWRTRHYAQQPAEEIEAQIEIKRRRLAAAETEQRLLGVGAPAGLSTAPPLPAATSKRRPDVGPVGRGGGPQGSAAGAEAAQRQRYVEEMVDVLLHLGGPAMIQASLTADTRAVLRLAAGGRRARTLRVRLRAWKAFSVWLAASHNESWPSSWARVLDYAQVRADEPCGRQTLLGLFAAVRFMEVASGFGPEKQVTTTPLYDSAVRELLNSVAARAGGGGPASANRPLVAQLIWLERMVIDVNGMPWVRAYCHWKLLQIWAALRYDDHRGLAVCDLELVDGSLSGRLSRTKTTGVDKPVAQRLFAVSSEAYVAYPAWLAEGVALWRELGPPARDYLLTAPCDDFQAGQARELTYAAAAGWSRALVFQWMVSHGAEDFGEAVGRHYTEHSGRGWLTSAAQALGATESQLEVIGGWRSKSSRGYMRAVGPKMRLIQAEVARAIRANLGGVDILGERALVARLRTHLLSQGGDEARVEALLADLTSFTRPSDDRRRWQADVDGVTSQEKQEPHDREGAEDPTDPQAAASRLHRDGRLPQEVSGFVVSISKKRGYRRLHLIGRCHRVPGIDYTDFEELGAAMPEPSKYDGVCGQCWRDGARGPRLAGSSSDPARAEASRAEKTGGDSEESGGSTDDSSSTDG